MTPWLTPPFIKSLPVPGVSPDTGSFVCIQVNPAWIPYILGACDIFRHDVFWKGTVEEIEQAAQQSLNLLNLIAGAGLCGGSMAFPVGAIIPLAGVIPADWLLCDGAAVSRAQYADLFAAIGTTYGAGNGTTTFNIPALSDRFVLGAGTNPAGTMGGESAHVLTLDEMPSHTHLYNNPTQTLPYVTQSGSQMIDRINPNDQQTGAAGGGQSHNNMPPFQAVPMYIYAGTALEPGCVPCDPPSLFDVYDFVPLDSRVIVSADEGVYVSTGYSFLRVTGAITINLGAAVCVAGLRVFYRRVSNAGNSWSDFSVTGVGTFQIVPVDVYGNTNIIHDYLFASPVEMSTIEITKAAGGTRWYIESITVLVCP